MSFVWFPEVSPRRGVVGHTIDSCMTIQITRPPIVSVDVDVLDYIGFCPFQVLVFLLAGLGYVSYGLEDLTFTFINIPIGKLWNMSTLQFSVLPATTSISNIVGAIVFVSLTDLYGRVGPFLYALAWWGYFLLASVFAGASCLVFTIDRLRWHWR